MDRSFKYSVYINGGGWLVGWLVVMRIYVALAIFQAYRDLEQELTNL